MRLPIKEHLSPASLKAPSHCYMMPVAVLPTYKIKASELSFHSVKRVVDRSRPQAGLTVLSCNM